jgi:hypothetical protein
MMSNNPSELLTAERAGTILGTTLDSIRLGRMQTHMNLSLIPVFTDPVDRPAYDPLAEAIKGDSLTISEVSESGSVPSLSVTNQGDRNVLIIDGEELMGAKQNRALNATVFIAANSRVDIPVSCTERGRWSYRSRNFHDSDVVLMHDIRKAKMASVSKSLSMKHGYASAQGEVWEEINTLHDKLHTHSPTSAMKDAYTSRQRDLDEYTGAFTLEEGQTGVLVFLNGKISALEMVSCARSFHYLHHKIVQSHAISAIANPQTNAVFPSEDSAGGFIERIRFSESTSHPSPGLGHDIRLNSEVFQGSALCVGDVLVHTLVFGK